MYKCIKCNRVTNTAHFMTGTKKNVCRSCNIQDILDRRHTCLVCKIVCNNILVSQHINAKDKFGDGDHIVYQVNNL
jgi:hypothetical protein